MTFDEFMKSERVTYKPTDDSEKDRLLRRCWDAAIGSAREAVEEQDCDRTEYTCNTTTRASQAIHNLRSKAA